MFRSFLLAMAALSALGACASSQGMPMTGRADNAAMRFSVGEYTLDDYQPK
jgi:hypothetical protein